MVKSDSKKGLSMKEANALHRQVTHCKPAIAEGDVDRLADLVFSKERVIRSWRLTALLASKDGGFYKDLSENEKTARALALAVGPLADFAKLLREVADLADCVSSRVAVAGCSHEHFIDWMNEPA